MNIWGILGIEETDDQKKIKAAYREKLREVNPEDSQEAFMELREAYEEALADARKREKEQSRKREQNQEQSQNQQDSGTSGDYLDRADEEDSVALWKRKLEELYQDNTRRFQDGAWEALFDEDVCFSLDTREEAAETFVEFFAEHFHISQRALLAAQKQFHFTESAKQLSEIFPDGLIDFLLFRVKNEEYPPYRYFAENPLPEADYNGFLEDFSKMREALDSQDEENAGRILKRMDETGIRHPAVEARRAWLYRKDSVKVERIFQEIEETWGDYDEAFFRRGELLLAEGRDADAQRCFEKVLEMTPDYESASFLLAVSLKNQKQYVQAEQVMLDSPVPGMPVKYADFLASLQDDIIREMEPKLARGKLDEEEIYGLAFAYYRTGHLDEAERTIMLLNGKTEWELKVVRFRALLQERRENWKALLVSADSLIGMLEHEQMTEKEKIYLSEAYFMRGQAKLALLQKEEGMDDMDRGIALAETPENMLMQKSSIFMHYEMYDAAYDTLTKLISSLPEQLLYRFMRGLCSFYMDHFQDAYEDFEYVREYDEDNMEVCICLTRIYLEVDDQEAAGEMFRFFEEKQYDTDAVQFLRGLKQEYARDYEQAADTYRAILRGYRAEDSDLMNVGEVSLRLAKVDQELDKRWVSVFKDLNQGLKLDPDYLPLLVERCRCNQVLELEDDLEKDLTEVLRRNPYQTEANIMMADLCYDKEKLDEAAQFIENGMKKDYQAELNLRLAFIKTCRADLEAAGEYLQKAEAEGADQEEILKTRGLYYSVSGEYEKAIDAYRNVHRLQQERASDPSDDREIHSFDEEIMWCFSHLGDFDQTRHQCEKMLRDGDEVSAWDYLFSLDLEQGLYDQAKKSLKRWQRARKKLFKDDDYRIREARLYLKQGQDKKARELLDQAEVSDGWARQMLGTCWLYEGNTRKAMKYLVSGIKEWPENAEFYLFASLACLMDRKPEKVKEYASRGLELMKKEQRIGFSRKKWYKNMVLAYTMLEDYDRAQQYLQEAMEAPMCVDCLGCACSEAAVSAALFHHRMGDEAGCMEILGQAKKADPDDYDIRGIEALIRQNRI